MKLDVKRDLLCFRYKILFRDALLKKDSEETLFQTQ